MVEVLCCCTPENVMGEISMEDGLAAGLPLRETIDEDGNEGVAFEHDHQLELPLSAMPHRKGGKTWKK